MIKTGKQAGYPSVDKPWRKFYKEGVLGQELPEWGLFDNIYVRNKEYPDNIALTYYGKHISYGKLFRSIAGAEKVLKDLKINKGDVVTFISVITPEFVYLLYACNKLGAIVNLLDPRLAANEMVDRVSITGSKLIVCLDACMEGIDESVYNIPSVENVLVIPVSESMSLSVKIGYALSTIWKKRISRKAKKFTLWKDCFAENDIAETEYKNNAYDGAAIFYTGGTTGDSKGVLLSTYSINAIAEQYSRMTDRFSRDESWLTLSIPFIAYGLICSLHNPLSLGMNANIELYDIPKLARSILKNKIVHASATPLVYIEMLKLLKAKEQKLDFLKMPISGGDKVPPALYDEVNSVFEKNGCTWKLCNGYGMTEVGSAACVGYKEPANKAGSSGIPFPNTIISAFNVDTDEECKTGEQGELRICGPGVMIEYYKNEKETQAAIKMDSDGRRWMCTGDLGYVDEDGCVFVLERMKRVIIRYDSFKIFASHVEEAAMKQENVMNCCCIGLPDTEHGCGETPVLVICLKDKAKKEATVEEVKKICAGELADYSRPTDIKVVSKMPITHAGKVDYRELVRTFSEKGVS